MRLLPVSACFFIVHNANSNNYVDRFTHKSSSVSRSNMHVTVTIMLLPRKNKFKPLHERWAFFINPVVWRAGRVCPSAPPDKSRRFTYFKLFDCIKCANVTEKLTEAELKLEKVNLRKDNGTAYLDHDCCILWMQISSHYNE
jgi:hypothetical protein